MSDASPASRPFLIVYNPASGARRGEKMATALVSALRRREIPSEPLSTLPGRNVFETIDPSRSRGILVLGGDGSIHAAVNGLKSFDAPLGFLGTGTINVLSRELSLPTDAEGFAEMVERGRTIEIPLLRVDDRRFLLFAEMGFLGRVVAEVNRWREGDGGRHGRLEYLWSTLRVLPRSWGRPLRVEFKSEDGESVVESYSNVLVTRARRYAGVFPMPIDPSVEHPLQERDFEIIGYRTRTPFGHLLLLMLAACRLLPRLRNRLEDLGLLHCRRAARLHVDGLAGTRGHVDAETLEASSAEIVGGGESLRLFVP